MIDLMQGGGQRLRCEKGQRLHLARLAHEFALPLPAYKYDIYIAHLVAVGISIGHLRP